MTISPHDVKENEEKFLFFIKNKWALTRWYTYIRVMQNDDHITNA